MMQGPKDQPCVAAALFGGQCVLPLAAAPTSTTTYSCDARALFKTRVWGSKPENVHCSSATAPLKIELRRGCEKSCEKIAVGSGVSFKYDPFGRRIYKASSNGTSVYAYDGDNLIEETNSSGAVVARYSQGLNLDDPLAMLRGGTTNYYGVDAMGSVTSLSNPAGALAQTYTFDSFGNQTASSGSLTNPFRFIGRELDSETGLYFFRARYYDSQIGRFISEDPIGFSGGDISVYRYSFNDPVNLEDPSGLTVTCTYNQSSGQLRCADDSTGQQVVNTKGYSGGNEGKCPSCVNNPFTQSTPFSGPIPTGYWSISSTCFTWKKMTNVFRLTPLVGSSPDAFQRSPGFLGHGGRSNGAPTASEGCIVIGQAQRQAICQAGGGIMHVVSGLPPATPPFPLFPPYPGKATPF
jgi:RHS repeat-associated protein